MIEPVKSPLDLLVNQIREVMRQELAGANGTGHDFPALLSPEEAAKIWDVPKGKQLRCLRGLLKMTQCELAEALDLAKDTIARMERDEMPIQRVSEFAVRYLLLMGKQRSEKR